MEEATYGQWIVQGEMNPHWRLGNVAAIHAASIQAASNDVAKSVQAIITTNFVTLSKLLLIVLRACKPS
jgi:hypothetical protein